MPADVTAAPLEVEYQGNRYRLSPLRDKDFGEFLAWVQDRYLDVAKRNLTGLSTEDRVTLLKTAYDKAASLTLSSPEAARLMVDIEGAAYLLYLSLRRETPEISHDKARSIATNPAALSAFMNRIDELNRIPELPRPFPRRNKRRSKRKK